MVRIRILTPVVPLVQCQGSTPQSVHLPFMFDTRVPAPCTSRDLDRVGAANTRVEYRQIVMEEVPHDALLTVVPTDDVSVS